MRLPLCLGCFVEGLCGNVSFVACRAPAGSAGVSGRWHWGGWSRCKSEPLAWRRRESLWLVSIQLGVAGLEKICVTEAKGHLWDLNPRSSR